MSGVEMRVRRVQMEAGSHVEPPLDQEWSHEEKLAWHAAVVAADTGLAVSASRADYKTKTLGVWHPTPGRWFNIRVGSIVAGPMDFARAWGYLNGVSAGARAQAGS